MSHVAHELAAEFPNHVERIRQLKAADAHFARLADEYHEANRAVHRMETRVEPASDEAEIAMRRLRARLKDQIAAALAGEAA